LVRNSKKIKFGIQKHSKISKKTSKISRKTRFFAGSGGKKSSLSGGGPRVWHMGPVGYIPPVTGPSAESSDSRLCRQAVLGAMTDEQICVYVHLKLLSIALFEKALVAGCETHRSTGLVELELHSYINATYSGYLICLLSVFD
jgi:hypothetical protein